MVWYMSASVRSVGSCMWMGEMERSLGQRTQEHDKSVKEGDSNSALSQCHVMTGHKLLNKPIIEGIRVRQ